MLRRFIALQIIIPFFFSNVARADAIDTLLQKLTPIVLKKMPELMAEGLENCAPVNPQTYAEIVRAWQEFIQTTGRVIAEQALELSLSPHYPTVCSVYSNNIASQYTETESSPWTIHSPDSWSDCFWHGHCNFTEVTATTMEPSYFWPKYFIETSDKGNDPYVAFASQNPLYNVDRSLASQVSHLVDQNGAVALTAQVVGMAKIFDTAMSAAGLPMNLGKASLKDVGQVAALTPFEALRIRSDTQDTQSVFDSNIWPVGWSAALGQLTVCSGYIDQNSHQQIGYSWPAGQIGVPDTCPVAMSRDAIAYWDTGMLDYVDPAAVTGMMAASNPATCSASAAITALSNMDSVRGNPLGDNRAVNQIARGLDASLSSVIGCSFPVIGQAAQIAKSAIGSVGRFGGPWCSVWGSIAPRNSTLVENTDYSFALMSQRFEFLAQELFGVPRPRHERWTLAYPWEGSLNLSGNANPTSLNPSGIVQSGIGKVVSMIPGADKLGVSMPASRSDVLMYPGDPRLIDTSLSPKHFADQAAEFAKEAAYITAGQAAGPAPWVAAELARNSADNARGMNMFPGNKRVYTVWDNITCKSSVAKVTVRLGGATILKQYYARNPNGSLSGPSCRGFIHFELYKLFQTELLRQLCDLMSQIKVLPGDQSLGAPFK